MLPPPAISRTHARSAVCLPDMMRMPPSRRFAASLPRMFTLFYAVYADAVARRPDIFVLRHAPPLMLMSPEPRRFATRYVMPLPFTVFRLMLIRRFERRSQYGAVAAIQRGAKSAQICAIVRCFATLLIRSYADIYAAHDVFMPACLSRCATHARRDAL